jgi:Copper type II ascorbate-dependent monooxygenase, N-terminal domain/Copper type II ascorbate-dependent monooxygenase, C-terminal domain
MSALRFFILQSNRLLGLVLLARGTARFGTFTCLAIALGACSEDAASPDAGTFILPSAAGADGGGSASFADAGDTGLAAAPPPSAADASTSTSTPGAMPVGSDAGAVTDAGIPSGPPAQSDGGTDAGYSWPSDCENRYIFRAHNNNGVDDTSKKQIAPGSQYYASYYFRPPWGTQEAQGLKFRTIIDNKKIVHHWILYGANSATQQDGAVQGGQGQPIGSMQGEFYIAGWAPGAPDIELPAGVGLHMANGASAMFRLEIHYFNTAADAVSEVDASGVEFCVTSHKRAAEAAIHWLGSTNISVPANGKTEVKSTCKPQISNGPVHLMSLSSHMHKTGVHSSAILNRASGGPPITLIDDPFSFLEQGGYKQPRDGSAPDLLINAGDSIDVTCRFDNTTNQAKAFGSNTEDEMCFFYAMAWPRGQLRNGSQFSIVPGAEPEVNCIR